MKLVFDHGSLYYCYYHYSTYNSCVLQYFILIWLSPWPHFDGATSHIGSAWCGSAAITDFEGHGRCCWPYHCAPDASSGICHLCNGSSTGAFLFQIWASHRLLIYVGVCSGVYFLLSGTILDAIFTNGAQLLVILQLQPWSIPLAGLCIWVLVICAH